MKNAFCIDWLIIGKRQLSSISAKFEMRRQVSCISAKCDMRRQVSSISAKFEMRRHDKLVVLQISWK